MATVFLHGTFTGNRGDMLMYTAAVNALRHNHRIVEDERDAEVILDCCGYWCGDPWGPWKAEEVATQCEQWKAAGKRVLLMPQTFGPFEDERARDAAMRIVHVADLVCARDAQSLQYLTTIVGKQTSIMLFPDYTIEVEAVPSLIFQPTNRSIAMIPNLRMMDKTSPETSAAYIPFLERCVDICQSLHAKPFLLIHEEKDRIFADQLSSIPVVLEPDAQKTKWIIGQSHAVISSRYHGILNALYQDVPVLATGWSHKFPALMQECDMLEQLVDVRSSDDVLKEHITRLVNEKPQQNTAFNDHYHKKTAELWRTIEEIIDTPATLGA